MINTLTYIFLAFIFLLSITVSVVRLYKSFPKMGIALVWGSLFVKMLFVISYTIAVRGYIENHIIYATFILIAVIHSMAHTLISLKKDKYF